MKVDSSSNRVVRRLAIVDSKSISINTERRERIEVQSTTSVQLKVESEKRNTLIINKLIQKTLATRRFQDVKRVEGIEQSRLK